MVQVIIIILNLIILESLLSIDNAAVLAVMVEPLPPKQRHKALQWGLWGAYIFRGLALFAVGILTSLWWLKIVGGLYLVYLSYGHFSTKVATIEEPDQAPGWVGRLGNYFKSKIGLLWSTIIMVEIADMIFSIDNIFAAIALSKSFWIVMLGVGIGMLAMRLVAGMFVKLLDRFPSLKGSAFIVIALLGLKLIVSGIVDGVANNTTHLHELKELLENHLTDLIFSSVMMLIFFIPLILKKKKEEVGFEKFVKDIEREEWII